jgi:PAS domain S-box-containing protein
MGVRVTLGTALLLLGSFTIITVMVVHASDVELRALILERGEKLSRGAARQIQDLVAAARADLAAATDILLLLDRAPWTADALLANHVTVTGTFECLTAVDAAGRVVGDSDLRAELPQRYPAGALDRARRGEEWASPVTVDDDGQPVMTMVLPAARGITFVGRLSLRRIWSLIDGVDAGDGGYAYLTTADGLLIAHPDKAAVLRGQPAPAPSPRLDLDVADQVPGLGWIVHVHQPVARAFAPVRRVLQTALVMTLLELVIAMALGVYLLAAYSRVVDELLRGTRRIAEGDLDYRIADPAWREFEPISRGFNAMAESLKGRTEALAESEGRYRRVIDSVRDVIFSVDGEGRLGFINAEAERLLGVPRDRMVGRTLRDLAALSVIRLARPDQELGARILGTRIPREVALLRPDGAEVVFEIDVVRAAGPTGAFHGVARDVTQRRLMEERLRRSERLAALGEIVSTVAHELRNAVAGITASMELARADGHGEALAAGLDRTLSEAVRAQDIVQRLLGSTAERRAFPRPCTLEEAVSAVVELRRGRLRALGTELRLELAEPGPIVLADPDQLRQVFHNIVDNAERALAELPPGAERRLLVRSRTGEDRAGVDVIDTGPGMEARTVRRLFSPYFTTREGGTGLGLAMSLAIAESFGGDISVASRAGEGSRFTVELPLAEPRPGMEPAPGIAQLLPAGVPALVVEDERTLRDFIRHFLERLGCRVDGAANGEEAVALLATGTPYAIIISDFSMPDRDGRDLYEWIRGSRPRLLRRLIYITGDSMNRSTIAFLEQAGVPFLLKPVAVAILEDEVRRVLLDAIG